MAKCSKCSTKLPESYSYCPRCAIRKRAAKRLIEKINLEKIKVLQTIEKIDIKDAEKLIEKKKLKAFSRFLFKPKASNIEVIELKKVYEPFYILEFCYKGEFIVNRNFELKLNPDAVAVVINGKEYKAKNGIAIIKARERIVKKKETISYLNVYGDQRDLAGLLENVQTAKFEPKQIAQNKNIEVMDAILEPADFINFVNKEMLDRPEKYKECLDEELKIKASVVYYRKYKAICKNLKTGESKRVTFSAIDGSDFETENF
jgi:hypothetical protein